VQESTPRAKFTARVNSPYKVYGQPASSGKKGRTCLRAGAQRTQARAGTSMNLGADGAARMGTIARSGALAASGASRTPDAPPRHLLGGRYHIPPPPAASEGGAPRPRLEAHATANAAHDHPCPPLPQSGELAHQLATWSLHDIATKFDIFDVYDIPRNSSADKEPVSPQRSTGVNVCVCTRARRACVRACMCALLCVSERVCLLYACMSACMDLHTCIRNTLVFAPPISYVYVHMCI